MSESTKERWSLIAKLSAIAGLIVSLAAAWAAINEYRPVSRAEHVGLKREMAKYVAENRLRILKLEPVPDDDESQHRHAAAVEELTDFIVKLEGIRLRKEFGLK